jgi:hypothetical protein
MNVRRRPAVPVRERARNEGVWRPRGGQPGVTLKQENMLVVPASFSPLH